MHCFLALCMNHLGKIPSILSAKEHIRSVCADCLFMGSILVVMIALLGVVSGVHAPCS